MTRLSICEMTTYRWSFEEDVEHCRAAGIPALGVWRQKLSDYGEEKGIELLAERGLQVSNLLWAGGFTGSEGRSFRDSIEDALEAIRLAAALRTDCLVVYSGARGGHTHNHARRLLKDAMTQLIPAAAAAGVVLAIEPMHPACAADCTFLTSLDDALAFLDQFDHPHVRLALDTYHLGWDQSLVRRIPQIADRVAIVHLGDGREPPEGDQNRCRLGEGMLPLKEIVTALSEAGYEGYYDVELMGEEIEASNYIELLSQSKQAFNRLCEPQVA